MANNESGEPPPFVKWLIWLFRKETWREHRFPAFVATIIVVAVSCSAMYGVYVWVFPPSAPGSTSTAPAPTSGGGRTPSPPPSVPTPSSRPSPTPPPQPGGAEPRVEVKIVGNVGSREPWLDSAITNLSASQAVDGLHNVVGTVRVPPLAPGAVPGDYYLEWWLVTPDGSVQYLNSWREDPQYSRFQQSADARETYWAKNKTIYSDQLGAYEMRVLVLDTSATLQLVGTAVVRVTR